MCTAERCHCTTKACFVFLELLHDFVTAQNNKAMAGHSQASEDLRVLNGQRQGPPLQTERDLVCNMSGHRAIAQAALQASAEEPDASAQADLGMQQALQSLMQDMKVLGLAKRPPPPQFVLLCIFPGHRCMPAHLMLHCGVFLPMKLQRDAAGSLSMPVLIAPISSRPVPAGAAVPVGDQPGAG